MAVKAREIIKREAVSYKQLLIIFVLLLLYQVAIVYIQRNASGTTSFIITIISTAIALGILFFIFKKILPKYELMVLENDFVIYRAIFFRAKLIYSIPLLNIKDIRKDYEASKISGKKRKFTVSGIKDKVLYVIEAENLGKSEYIYIQCSKKFMDKLEKTIKKRKNNE